MDQNSWNQLVLNDSSRFRSGLFLQSWDWGEFQKSVGREIRRYEVAGSVAQVISHPIKGPFFGWDLYRGPVGIMDKIVTDIKKTNGIFLHIEPNEELSTFNFQLLASKNKQPQHTLIVDLTKHEELLMAEMHEKTRYNIRLSERQGVRVKSDNSIEDFIKLLKQTASRDKFSAHPEEYYRKMVEVIPDVKLFIAYHGNDALAGALVIFFGKTATYLHGASSNEKRNLMAPHLLHWEIIKEAKAAGCTAYDFWGIAPENESNHAWAGITRFKKGFGGEIVSMPAAVELPLRKNLYRMYTLVKNLRP